MARSLNDTGQEGTASSLVLFANVGTVMGGAEVYIYRLVELLSHQFPITVFTPLVRLSEQLHSVGALTYSLPFLGRPRLNKIIKYVSSAVMLVFLTFKHKIRTVHLNGYQTSYLIPISKLLGLKVLITPHHLPDSWLFRIWYRATARWVDCAVNVSRVMDNAHRSLLPNVRSVVIPNWVPRFLANTSQFSESPTYRILYVGRIVGNKGLATLIDAIRLFDGKVALLISGEGPLRTHFELQAKGLPVTFLGFASDLQKLYSQVDALVIPSEGPEGSCLVGLEAMASGLPCIMSDLPVFREIAENGEAALIFKTGDAADLARAVHQIVTERGRTRQMADHARKMVDVKYSEQIIKAQYVDLFEQIQFGSRRDTTSQSVA